MALVLATKTETGDITTWNAIGTTYTPSGASQLAANMLVESLNAAAATISLRVTGGTVTKIQKGKRKPDDADTFCSFDLEPFHATGAALTFSALSSNSNDTSVDVTIKILEAPITPSGTVATATNTGTVTGNVDGSAASVTGAVGSVSGNVDGSVASVTAGVNTTQIEGVDATDQINAAVDAALDTAIPGTPTADSINERIKAIDAKLPSKAYLTGTANADGDVEMDEATGNYPGTVGQGPGATTFTYTVYEDDDTTPIDGCEVWASTDSAGSTVVAARVTDTNGEVEFFLDDGTYYIWRRHSDWTFSNPDTEVVAGT